MLISLILKIQIIKGLISILFISLIYLWKVRWGCLTPGSLPKIDMGMFNEQREGNVVDLKKTISNNDNMIKT